MGENLIGLVLDVRRAKKQPQGIARRRRARLGAMIAFAHAKSPFYRKLYAFDEWLTDRSVHLAEVQAFTDDPAKVGDAGKGWPRFEDDLKGLIERHGLSHVRIERADEPAEQTKGGKVRPIIPFQPKD